MAVASPRPSAASPRPFAVAVTVTYRRPEQLKRVMDAVEGQTRPPDLYMVIDNGRSAQLPEGSSAELIRPGSNLGPAGGYAMGLKAVLDRGADRIWTVDDDVLPEPTCLERLLEIDAPIVQPRVVWKGQSETWWTLWACGLIEADAIRRVGFPRPDYFWWAEDVEYLERFDRAGEAVVRIDEPLATHLAPPRHTRGQTRDWRLYYMVRNRLHYQFRVMEVTGRRRRVVLMGLAKTAGAIALLERHKSRSMAMFARGVLDFRRGRMGKIVDPETWDQGGSLWRRMRETDGEVLPGSGLGAELAGAGRPASAERVVALTVAEDEAGSLGRVVAAVLGQTRPPDRYLVMDLHGTAADELGGAEDVAVVRPENAHGRAGGYAEGFRLALESDADRVWVVAPDAAPDPRTLESLLADRRDVALPRRRHVLGNDRWRPWYGGLFRADTVRRAGVPDREYVYGLEDRDFLRRLRLVGGRVARLREPMVSPALDGRWAEPAASPWALYYLVRNTLHFFVRVQYGGPRRYVRAAGIVSRAVLSALARGPDRRHALALTARGFRDFRAGRMGNAITPGPGPH